MSFESQLLENGSPEQSCKDTAAKTPTEPSIPPEPCEILNWKASSAPDSETVGKFMSKDTNCTLFLMSNLRNNAKITRRAVYTTGAARNTELECLVCASLRNSWKHFAKLANCALLWMNSGNPSGQNTHRAVYTAGAVRNIELEGLICARFRNCWEIHIENSHLHPVLDEQ